MEKKIYYLNFKTDRVMLITNSRTIPFTNKFIDIEALPNIIQQELIDYYQFLLDKYVPKKKERNKKALFFKSVAKHCYNLPNDYTFNRDEANER